MRNVKSVFTGIFLSASLSAFASIEQDIKNDISPNQALTNAVALCQGSGSCLQLAVQDLLIAKVDIDTVVSIALSQNISITQISSAAKAQKVSTTQLIEAAIKADIPATEAITAASTAALKSGDSVQAVMAAAIAAKDKDGNKVDNIDLVQGVTQGAVNADRSAATVLTAAQTLGIPQPQIVAGALQTSLTQSEVEQLAKDTRISQENIKAGNDIVIALQAQQNQESTGAGNTTGQEGEGLQNNQPNTSGGGGDANGNISPSNGQG